MFCRNCGTQIADDALFCTSCGAKQNNDGTENTMINNAVNNAMSMRAYETMQLQETTALFKQAEPVMSTWLDEISSMAEIQKKADDTKRKSKKKWPYLLWGFVAFYGLITGVAGFMSNHIFTGLLGFAAVGVPLVFLIKSENKYANINKEFEKQIDEIADRITILSQDPSVQWIPENYRDPIAYQILMSYITDGRAISLREAINLYENDKNNMRF